MLLGIAKILGKLRISDILTLFVPTLLDSSHVRGVPLQDSLVATTTYTLLFQNLGKYLSFVLKYIIFVFSTAQPTTLKTVALRFLKEIRS